MTGRGRSLRPGPWAAPVVLMGSLAMVTVVVVVALRIARSGPCEWRTGDSVFGTSGLSMVPFGPTCTLDGVVDGPAPAWTALLVAFGLLAVVAAGRIVVRGRVPTGAGSPTAPTAWSGAVVTAWLQAGLLGGALGGGAIAAGVWILSELATLAGWRATDEPVTVASVLGFGTFLGLVGMFVGLVCGGVVALAAGQACIWMGGRLPPPRPASYALVGAAVSGPASWLVVASLLHLFDTTAAGVVATATAIAAVVGVVALPLGAWAWGLVDRRLAVRA